MTDHIHSEGADPRYAGRCVKCGMMMPAVANLHRAHLGIPMDNDPFLHSRDKHWEQLITYREAAGVDVVKFVEAAEKRADAGAIKYGFEFPSEARDLELDAWEELVDLRNYIVWELDRYRRGHKDRNEQRELRLRRRLRLVCQIASDMIEDRPDLLTATQPGGHRLS